MAQIHAYPEEYIYDAQRTLGEAVDFAAATRESPVRSIYDRCEHLASRAVMAEELQETSPRPSAQRLRRGCKRTDRG